MSALLASSTCPETRNEVEGKTFARRELGGELALKRPPGVTKTRIAYCLHGLPLEQLAARSLPLCCRLRATYGPLTGHLRGHLWHVSGHRCAARVTSLLS